MCFSVCLSPLLFEFVGDLQITLRLFQEEIKAVIKQLQGSARALQHICAHAKVEKDQRVFKLVPLVKRNLEAMLFKVKALTEAMGCLAAFSVGNLKHRNLQGQEVCSQVVEDDGEDEDEDEDAEEEEEEGSEAATPGRRDDEEDEDGDANDTDSDENCD